MQSRISGAVFDNKLASQLALIDGLTPELISAVQGSVAVIESLPPPLKGEVVDAAVKALDPVFIVCLVAATLGSLSSMFGFQSLAPNKLILHRAE